MRSGLISFFLFQTLLLVSASPALGVELFIENELKEYESGNLLLIEDGRSFESPKSKFRVSIYPGKTIQVTKGNVNTFTLVRPFERHKLKYEISCPEDHIGRRATVTLLDVHKNNLPGGCQVERLGHWSRRGGLKWKDVR